MYSFDGTFKAQPIVSLGNAKPASPKSIIEASRKSREQRQKAKNFEKAALIVQKFMRSCCVRLKLKRRLMTEFEERLSMCRTDTRYIGSSIYRLNYFFQTPRDRKCWLALAQIILTQKNLLEVLQKSETGCSILQIRYLVLICKKDINLCISNNENMSLSLRVLETLCTQNSFNDSISRDVLENGYFPLLLAIAKKKIPEDALYRPDPSRDERCKFVLSLFKFVFSIQMSSYVREKLFISDVIAVDPYSPYVTELLIPAMAESLDASKLTRAFDELSKSEDGTPRDLSSLYLYLRCLKISQNANIGMICSVLANITSAIVDEDNKKSRLATSQLDGDESEDEGEDMDFEESSPEPKMRSRIADLLDSPEFVSSLKSLLPAAMDKQSSVVNISRFVYSIMQLYPKSKMFFALPTNSKLLRQLWSSFVTLSAKTPSGQQTSLAGQLISGTLTSHYDEVFSVLGSFCRIFGLLLVTLHDEEFLHPREFSFPFSRDELLSVITTLRDAALGITEMLHPESRFMFKASDVATTHKLTVVFKLVYQLLRQLHDRDQRLSFSPGAEFWISSRVILPKSPQDVSICEVLRRGVDLECALSAEQSFSVDDAPNSLMLTVRDKRILLVLSCLPYCIHFHHRVKLFRKIIMLDRMSVEGANLPAGVGPSIDIHVRRTHLYEDAYEKLSLQNEPDLRKRIRVTMKNMAGLDEAGIDGGGITREFLQELVKAAFDPKRAFFTTTSQQNFYPFPHVSHIVGESFRSHYYFIGRVVGKLLYENLLVELPLAPFFLAKILSGHVDINYLASLDQQLHENLMSLKTCQGDVEDLTLTFCGTQSVLGNMEEIELIPGGKDIPVTESNKVFYMHTVADYWLNKQIRAQYSSFVQGLSNLISLKWLRMFSAPELQTLLSGAQISIDVEDMRKNVRYDGPPPTVGSEERWSDEHPYIQMLWKVVQGMTDEQKSLFLKFITSCSRPPLLGFKELYPPITIQLTGESSAERLPSASTCMNLLKLPVFPTEAVLRDKLLTAIQSHSGFELS